MINANIEVIRGWRVTSVQSDVPCDGVNMSRPAPVTVRNSVVPLPHTASYFQNKQIQERNFQLDEVVWAESDRLSRPLSLQEDRITILAPSNILHSPPVEDETRQKLNTNSRSSSYFPPTSLNYYPSTPLYPMMPHVPAYMYPAYYQQDTPQDRIDAASVSLVSLLPSLLKSVLVPVLAAGSAVWLSQNLPTPVVQERRRRHTENQRPGDTQSVLLPTNIETFTEDYKQVLKTLKINNFKARHYAEEEDHLRFWLQFSCEKIISQML